MSGTYHDGAADRRAKTPLSRLPYELREELCRRLRDGTTWRAVAAWLAERGHPGINAQNVTNFRKGAYREWLKEQARLEPIRARAEAIRRELDAGGFSILDKSIYELAERLTDADLDPAKAAAAVAALKNAVLAGQRTEIAARRAEQAEQALRLEREKWEEQKRRNAEAREKLAAVAAGGGISPETLARIEEAIGLL